MPSPLKTYHIVIAGIAAVLIAAGVLAVMRRSEDAWLCEEGRWVRHGDPSSSMPTEGCGVTVPLADSIYSFIECVNAGYPIMESYPRQCRTQSGNTFVEDIGNELQKSDLIRVTEPRPHQIVISPFLVKGEARGNWFFEASFPIELRGADGAILALGIAHADAPWMTTEFVPFHMVLEYTLGTAPTSALLVLKKDNPSGLPEYEDQLEMPLLLDLAAYAGGPVTVNAYFGNAQKDPTIEDCGKVWPVVRTVGSVELAGLEGDELRAQRALEQLLLGPTNREQQEGYFSSINFGTRVQRMQIDGDTAAVDFDGKMEEGMGGSCRVTAIRAQVAETLKQFSGIHHIVISVDGRTEDILQP